MADDSCEQLLELMDSAPALALPSFVGETKAPRVSCETMAGLLRGEFKKYLDYFLVVDCRYDFEFNGMFLDCVSTDKGGHISGAVCLNRKEMIKRFHSLNSDIHANIAIIFHCEYSKNRGPRAADYFRTLDRAANVYPTVVCKTFGLDSFITKSIERS